ncbi:MAG: hypothetical protein AB9842_00170 [Bacteroidales bacterium]
MKKFSPVGLTLFTEKNIHRLPGKVSYLFLFLFLLYTIAGFTQTTVFSDDFNRASVSPGGTPSMTYVMTNTGGGSSAISSTPLSGTEPFLRIANGAPAGRSYVTGTLSTFSAPFQTALATNTGLITWSFNVRHNRNSTLGGFNSAAYGAAIVLVASDANFLASGCNGYAIAQGGNSSNDYRLVRFTNGLGATANLTTMISGLLPADRRDYMSVKVTYDPLTGNWKLYERRDASFSATSPPASWQDASGLSEANLMGMFTDNTYTGVPMTSFGYLWNYSTAGGQYFYVDNFSVTHTALLMPALIVSPFSLSGFNYMEGFGPSAKQLFVISGNNLVGAPGDITLSGSANYEVSVDGDFYSTNAIINYTGTTLNPDTIFVRLKPGLPAGNYNSEVISCSGGGAPAVLVNCSGYVLSPPKTYTWTGSTNNEWTTASNWNPVRTNPVATDILQFNDGNTYTVTQVPTQTISKLLITENSKITLQSSASATLTINGDTETDLVVTDEASELVLSGASPILLSIASGATAEIKGKMEFSQGAHRLLAIDSGSVQFLGGAFFIANTGFSGNAFGTANLNSIIFNTESVYLQNAGSNPFGASQPNSVVKFIKGSLLKFTASFGSPAFSGRTYADFEYDVPSTVQNPTGSYPLSIDNFTLTQGVVNFDFAGGVTIKGNIFVATGAQLSFGNLTNVTVVTAGGSGSQSLGGGGNLIFGEQSTFIVNNASGLFLQKDIAFNNLTLTQGIVSTDIYSVLVIGTLLGGSEDSHINGKLSRIFESPGTLPFPIGKNNAYRPVTIEFSYLDGVSTVTAEQYESALTGTPEPGVVIYPDRYWSITQTGSTDFYYNITLDGTGYNVVNSPRVLKKDASNILSYQASYVSPYFTVNNLTSFSDFALGEFTPLPNLVINGNLSPFNTTLGSPSSSQFYLVQGTNLVDNVVITAPPHFELFDMSGGEYTNSITLTPFSGNLPLTQVIVRFNPSVGGLVSGNIAHQTAGSPVQNRAVTGTSLSDALSVNTNILSGFTYIQGFGPSASQSFTLEGNSLSGNVTVTAPSHYRISLNPGSGFTNSLSLTPVSGTLSPVSIYVRLVQALFEGNYNNEQISITSLYSVPEYVSCHGSVSPPPTLSTSVNGLSGFSYIAGSGPSNSKIFTVSGQNLVGNISITAALHYEVSLNQSSGYSNSVSIIQTGGVVPTTTVYVRLKAGLNPGNYNNEVVGIASSGAINKTVICNGTVFTMPVITLSQTSLSGFSYIVGTGPSPAQTIIVTGSNMQNALMITAPEDYEITTGNGSAFYPSLFLIPSSGFLTPTTVHIRLKAGLLIGTYNNESVIFSSIGAVSKNVNCDGAVLAEPVPALTITSIDGFGDVCLNAEAGPEEISLQGTTLTNEPILVQCQENFYISTTPGGEFVSSLSFSQPGGVFSTLAYLKFIPTAAQAYSGNIVASGGGAPEVSSWLEGTGVAIPPTVITSNVVESVTGNSALCAGNVTDEGCNEVQFMGICYGIVADPDTSGTRTTIGGGNGAFSSLLENLLPATVYYFRAYALSASGLAYGDEYQFTTLAVLPAIITGEATEITGMGARLNCLANANNSETELSFEYGIDLQYGNTVTATPSQVGGFNNTAASAEISGLEPNTIYHFRAIAMNDAGVMYGDDQVFQTLTIAPFVQSVTVTENCGSVARLHGIVRANNQEASVMFEYGPTEEYGYTVIAVPEMISGNTAVDVFADISGLIDNTPYHFRVVASNETGISYGNDITFSTNALPEVDAGNNDTIEYLDQVQLQGSCLSGMPPYQYFWSPPYNLSDINISNPIAYPLSTTTYSLWVVDGNGCLGTDSVIIVVSLPEDTLSGVVYYDNVLKTPMNNTTVVLSDHNYNVLSTTVADNNGRFYFGNYPAGLYHIGATTTKPWGGANSTDALIILRHFTGMIQLSGLPLLAANVTLDNFVNSVDALVVSRRFIQLITSFPAGDWVFSSPLVNLTGTGTNHLVDVKALCFGDVNQSHVPALFKTEPSVSLVNEGRLIARENESILVPLMLNSDVELGAFSLVLNYTADNIEIQGVIGAGQINGQLLMNSFGDQLRISWYSLNPSSVKANEPLVYIRLKLKDKRNLDKEILKLGNESEFAGVSGDILSGLVIQIPRLEISEGNLSLNTYPNPCTAVSKVQFNLPAEGKVSLSLHNLLGAGNIILQDEVFAEGLHETIINAHLLSPGLYMLKLTVISGGVASSAYCKVMIYR